MTHKVHPKIYRIRETSDWLSRGFYKEAAKNLEEDFNIRSYIETKYRGVGIEKVEIERYSNKLNVIIYTSRPGIIIGRGGEGVEQIKKEIQKKILKQNLDSVSTSKKEKGKERDVLNVEIKEVRNPWMSARLSAQWIAQQIEKRVNHRRVLKQALSKIMSNKEVKGAKVEVSGRLNGAEIARREWLKEGRMPLQTIRSDIDYAREEAYCTYGVIGVKVWIYKGEKFD